MPKTLREVQRFMDQERLASFATVGFKNEPHIVPVFFTYDEGKVFIQSDRKSVKVRNLTHNDSVAVAVYGGEEAFVKRTQDHIDKYRLRLDERGRDTLGIPLFDRSVRCVIEVTPKRILSYSGR